MRTLKISLRSAIKRNQVSELTLVKINLVDKPKQSSLKFTSGLHQTLIGFPPLYPLSHHYNISITVSVLGYMARIPFYPASL